MKKALITGVTGQDGAYLAEFLLKKGYMDVSRLAGLGWQAKTSFEAGLVNAVTSYCMVLL